MKANKCYNKNKMRNQEKTKKEISKNLWEELEKYSSDILDNFIKENAKWEKHSRKYNVVIKKNGAFLIKNNTPETTEVTHYKKKFDINYLSSVDFSLVTYIFTKFTKDELHLIFNDAQEFGYYNSGEGFKLAKRNAIQFINEHESLSIEEKKRMKRKVWNINYILFGLILNFVLRKNAFYNTEKDETICPN